MDYRITVPFVTAMLFGLVACGSDNDSQAMLSDDEPQAAMVPDDPLQCDAPAFDVAELLFTESDRQWFCTVTVETFVTEDQVFFSRSGTAVMTRFRDVYWNRSMADQSINVASPFISPFVIRNISSSNTVLSFDLITDSDRTEVYDCVLVGRDIAAPDLI